MPKKSLLYILNKAEKELDKLLVEPGVWSETYFNGFSDCQRNGDIYRIPTVKRAVGMWSENNSISGQMFIKSGPMQKKDRKRAGEPNCWVYFTKKA